MGWCFRPVYATHESSSLNYDCLNVRFYYKESEINDPTANGYTETFIGQDIFAPKLDPTHILPLDLTRAYIDSNISSTGDKSGDWTINKAKSYKTCPSQGNCVFNAHFYRNFITNDQNDYQITKGSNLKYEAYGYAVEYDDIGGTRDTIAYVVGPTQIIKIENLAATYESAEQR